MKKFPSIEQFRHVIRHVRDCAVFHGAVVPAISYIGTVKLHGTNGGITRTANGELVAMSRNRNLTVDNDNHGFAKFVAERENVFNEIIDNLGADGPVQLFGEWCGQGIQSGVGVSKLPRMFVIFAARCFEQENEAWIHFDDIKDAVICSSAYRASWETRTIAAITEFPTFYATIDFNKPEQIHNTLVEMTMEVEASCPVARKLGADGIGEGIVWRPATFAPKIGDYLANTDKLWFKVKGEKHSTSKVSTLAPVDVEKFAARDALVAAVVTDRRCQQGIEYLQEHGIEVDIRNIGTYLRWVFGDVLKEEADTIAASGFTQKDLGRPISDVAKRYFNSVVGKVS